MTLPRPLLPALLLAALPSCGETTQDEPAPRHWLRRFGTPEKDYVGALGLLPDSRLVVVGGSEGRLELDGNSFEPDQLFTASFDRTGHVTRAVADGGDMRWLLPGGDFVSSGGGVLSASPQPSFVQRVTADGEPLWRWDQSWDAPSQIWDVSADPNGNVLISGEYDTGQSRDFVGRLHADGTEAWILTLDDTEVGRSRAMPDGGVVFASYQSQPGQSSKAEVLVRLDPQGSVVWELAGLKLPQWNVILEVGGQGAIVTARDCLSEIAPVEGVYSPFDLCVDAVGDDGTLRWKRRVPIDGFTLPAHGHLTVAESGRIVFFSGIEAYSPNGYTKDAGLVLVELDADGNVLSVRGPKSGSKVHSGGVAVDEAGDIYLVGRFAFELFLEDWHLKAFESTSSEDTDIFVAKVPAFDQGPSN